MQDSGSRSFRMDIQGLRGIAVLLVVLFHAEVSGFSGGFVGVDVFFVISGFVIGQMLLSELEATGRLDLKRFFLRRVRRLMPALALMLGCVAVASAFLISTFGQQRAARTGAAASLISANVYLTFFDAADGYFGAADALNPFLHTWSLSVEEQFYLAVPLLMAWTWRIGARTTSPRTLTIVMLAVVFATSFVGAVALTSSSASNDSVRWAFYLSPLRAWEFIAGILVAAWRRPSFGRLLPIVPWLGGLLIGWASFRFSSTTRFPGINALFPVFGTALILSGMGPISVKILSLRPLAWIGDISYSFYLWHWPFIVFARAWWPTEPLVLPLAAAISIAPAAASYRWLENPLRRVQVPALRTVRLACLSIVIPLSSVLGLEFAYRSFIQTEPVADIGLAERLPDIYNQGCDSALLSELPAACSTVVDDGTLTALLVGDSNAAQWATAARTAAQAVGYSLDVVVKSACPPALVMIERRGERFDECAAFVADASSVVATTSRPYDLVIIAAASDRYLFSNTLLPIATDDLVAQGDSRSELYSQGLFDFVSNVASHAGRVVIIHPIQKTSVDGRWSLTDCPFGKVRLVPQLCVRPFSADASSVRREAIRTEQSALGAVPNVEFVDMQDLLCTSECQTYRDGLWLWRDDGHLTVAGAALATSRFESIFADELE